MTPGNIFSRMPRLAKRCKMDRNNMERTWRETETEAAGAAGMLSASSAACAIPITAAYDMKSLDEWWMWWHYVNLGDMLLPARSRGAVWFWTQIIKIIKIYQRIERSSWEVTRSSTSSPATSQVPRVGHSFQNSSKRWFHVDSMWFFRHVWPVQSIALSNQFQTPSKQVPCIRSKGPETGWELRCDRHLAVFFWLCLQLRT